MRLYRGIAVPESFVDATVQAIRDNGLLIGDSLWSGLTDPDLKPRLDALWREPNLSTALTRPGNEESVRRICACALERDALYYACSHNRSQEDTASIVISFEVDQRNVTIDGRDFFATVFQLGKPTSSRKILADTFGPSVLRYADRSWAASETSARIACCDLARQDDEVIAAHALNKQIIGGRHRTRFSSAFMVAAPVPWEFITSVDRVDHRIYRLPDIDISLDQALGR